MQYGTETIDDQEAVVSSTTGDDAGARPRVAAGPAGPPLLAVEGLTKRYGDQAALDGVTFDVRPGEKVALLGANGAGKTTTVRALCRLLDWEEGDIRFAGEPIRKRADYLAKVGAVLEARQNLNMRLNVEQNAFYLAGIRGLAPSEVRANVDRLRDQLGLTRYGKKIVAQLSAGNKQKAALCAVLSFAPKLVLLDEPTLGLDLETVDELGSIIIRQAAEEKQAFIITSHDIGFIDRVCDRIVILREGKVIVDCSKEEFRMQRRRFVLKAVLSQEDAITLKQAPAALFDKTSYALNEDSGEVTLSYDDASRGLPFVSWMHEQGIAPSSLEIARMSLETAYKNIAAEDRS